MSVSKLTAENCRDNALESKATGLAEMMDSAVHIARRIEDGVEFSRAQLV